MKQSNPTKEFIRKLNNIFVFVFFLSIILPMFFNLNIGHPYIYLGIAASFGVLCGFMDIN